MAITIRYGDTGDALGAAVAAGEGQDFARRREFGQSLVQAAQQKQLQEEALRLEAFKLQTAAQQQRRLTGSPIPAGARVISPSSPLGQSLQGEKQPAPAPTFQRDPFAAPGTGTGTVRSGDEEFRITGEEVAGFRKGEQIPAEEVQQRGGSVRAGTPPVGPRVQMFQQMLADPALSPQQRRELQALAGMDNLTDAQALKIAEEIRRPDDGTGLEAAQEGVKVKVRDLNNQIKRIRDEMLRIEREAAEVGLDVRQSPTPPDPNRAPTPEEIMVRRYHRLQNSLQQAVQERDAVGGVPGQQAPAGGAGQPSEVQQQMAEMAELLKSI